MTSLGEIMTSVQCILLTPQITYNPESPTFPRSKHPQRDLHPHIRGGIHKNKKSIVTTLAFAGPSYGEGLKRLRA